MHRFWLYRDEKMTVHRCLVLIGFDSTFIFFGGGRGVAKWQVSRLFMIPRLFMVSMS